MGHQNKDFSFGEHKTTVNFRLLIFVMSRIGQGKLKLDCGGIKNKGEKKTFSEVL